MNVLMSAAGKNKKKNRRKKSKKGFGVNLENNSLTVVKPPMETWDVNSKEHKILKKYRKWLEKRFNVQIKMPETASIESDIIFVCIEGEDTSRQFVKRFLAEKKKEKMTFDETPKEDNIPLITLSDSESESGSGSESESEESVCELKSEDGKSDKSIKSPVKSERLDDSICIINNPPNSSDLEDIACNDQPKRKKRKAECMKVRSQEISSSGASDLCEVTSTTDDGMVSKKAKLSESVLIIDELGSSSKPAVEFIPLMSEKESVNQKNGHTNTDDSIVVIDDQPTDTPRCLRPIVIDGSNVAMEHGRTSHTFSVKGLKLAIDYFLNRGHSLVTAFVPKFRRSSNPNRTVPTTNAEIFDELEKHQHVVFTPSRRVNGKNISSYDDRFIVQFAASNGGIIVSNDNFRDLLDENEAFKEAIEKRLLMFCFVGDVFMVPDDPLGRDGPKLNEFLSFPPENEKQTDVKVKEEKV